jgi:hypothetical protein
MKKFISFFVVLFLTGFVFAQTDVLPPELVSPDDGDDDQPLDVTMDWLAVSGIGPITYELQYDTDEQFSDPVIIMTEFTSANGENLLFDTTYYWRVRAMDNSGTSNWSDVFHFITFVQIDLDDPDDEDTDIDPRMEIEWRVKYGGQALTGNNFYEYEIAYDTNFENVYRHGFEPWEDVTGNAQSKIINLLYFDTTYYWRVRTGHEVDTSIWSETWSFSTINSVTHDLPDDGATGQMIDATLVWDDIPGAFEYIYELCDDPNFNTPCIFYSDESSAVADGLLFGTMYYWRVKAAHTEDTTDWSEAWSFETLGEVALLSPEDGSFVDDLFPTLSWNEVTGVSGFILQYDTDQNFSEPTTDSIDADESSHKVLFSLEMDETYYWRMKAYQIGDTTQWSEVWSFTIGETPQSIGELLSDQNVNIFPNPARTELTVEIHAIRNTHVEMDVLNVLGQSVLRRQFDLNQGRSNYTFPVHDLEEGLYIIQLRSEEDTLMKKVVIEK